MDTSIHLSLNFIEKRIVSLESLSTEVASTEAFAIIRQIENVFFRVVNNFKTNITKGFSDFKRSELAEHKDSHHGDVKEILRSKKWINLNKLMIPVPKSLHRPYLVSSEHLHELFTEASYMKALWLMVEAISHIHNKNDESTTDSIKQYTKKLYDIWGTQGYVPDKDRLLPYIDLSTRGQTELTTSDVFSGIEDIEKTMDVILSYETFFSETVVSEKTLVTLEKSVDTLVSSLEHAEKITSGYVGSFHELISTYSTFLDSYAMFLQAGQVLEHCFVLDLKVFAKA